MIPMQVGIDIGSVIYHRGVSRYTTNLIQGLLENSRIGLGLWGSSLRQKKELEKYVQKMSTAFPHRVEQAIVQLPPTLLDLSWRFLKKPLISDQLPNIDVFHSWDWLQPPDTNVPLVSTIHDLAILKFPSSAHAKILAAHQRSWQILKQRNAQIIAVSQTTKKDLIELLNWNPRNIHVIYEALPQEVMNISHHLSEEEVAKYISHFKLGRPFFFFVGTREPRKNLLRVIDAWQPFSKDFDLVIAGESGWDETQKVSQSGLHLLGKISDKALAALYSQAELFLYPSLYEGFGLPILEAFHYGLPVITSHNSGMKEVAGNAAELVDPEDVDSIKQAITTILQEDTQQHQKRLQKMIIRLHMFDWKRTALETLQVYRLAANQKGK